jgi:hypothetical protein
MKPLHITLSGNVAMSAEIKKKLLGHTVSNDPPPMTGKLVIWLEPILYGEESYITQAEIIERSQKKNVLSGILTGCELLSHQDAFPVEWKKHRIIFPSPLITDRYGNDDLTPNICPYAFNGNWDMYFVCLSHACAPKPRPTLYQPNLKRRARFACWKYQNPTQT